MARPDHLEPWNVNAGDYPRDGAALAQHRFLLSYAILAPSSHNTQPGGSAWTTRASKPDWVARVTRGPAVAPSIDDVNLFDAIPTRHTNRQKFDPTPVSYRIADELIQAAAVEGAWLVRLLPDQRTRAAELIAAADRTQFSGVASQRTGPGTTRAPCSARRRGTPD